MVRLNVPPLSVEQRKKLSSRVKDLAEEARVAIRNIRRDANKQADLEQAEKILTEDDLATCKEEIQTLTKQFEGKVNEWPRRNPPRSWRSEPGRIPANLGLFPVPCIDDAYDPRPRPS